MQEPSPKWLADESMTKAINDYGQMCREYRVREATDFPMSMEEISKPRRELRKAAKLLLANMPSEDHVARLAELDEALKEHDSNVHSRQMLIDGILSM